MRKLSVPSLAVALTAALVMPECDQKVTKVRDEANNNIKELWLKAGSEEEQDGRFGHAAVAYESAGDKAKARELWLKAAQKAEQNGYLEDASRSYAKAGDKAKARELWLKAGPQAE